MQAGFSAAELRKVFRLQHISSDRCRTVHTQIQRFVLLISDLSDVFSTVLGEHRIVL